MTIVAPARRHLVRRRPIFLTSGLFPIAATFFTYLCHSRGWPQKLENQLSPLMALVNPPIKHQYSRDQDRPRAHTVIVGILKGSLPGTCKLGYAVAISISPPFLWTSHLICPYPPAHKEPHLCQPMEGCLHPGHRCSER